MRGSGFRVWGSESRCLDLGFEFRNPEPSGRLGFEVSVSDEFTLNSAR